MPEFIGLQEAEMGALLLLATLSLAGDDMRLVDEPKAESSAAMADWMACHDAAVFELEDGEYTVEALEKVIARLQVCVEPHRRTQAKIASNRALLTNKEQVRIADMIYSPVERRGIDLAVASGLRELARYKQALAEFQWSLCIEENSGDLESCDM